MATPRISVRALNKTYRVPEREAGRVERLGDARLYSVPFVSLLTAYIFFYLLSVENFAVENPKRLTGADLVARPAKPDVEVRRPSGLF